MQRLAILFAFSVVTFLPAVASALPVGAPGFALEQGRRTFAVSGGVGYNYRFMEGSAFKNEDKLDPQKSFRFLVRAEAAVLPWLTPMATIGLADRTRTLTEFDGTLGPLFGAGLRLDPLIQDGDDGIGIAVVTQFSYEKSVGSGLSRYKRIETDDYYEQDQTAHVYHFEATALISRKEGRFGIYAGPKFDYDRTVYTKRSEVAEPILPVGVVVGVDYDITPEVFFTAEMENFHQDALYGLVGARF